MLQNTVPVTIQTSKREKPTCTPPILNLFCEKPTVKRTKATARARRLLLEWKYLSSQLRAIPATAPIIADAPISMIGSTITEITLILPVSSADAIPKDTEKRIRPTASSIATTINKSFVKGPSALYCLTTISVAAGAVAAAMAPRVMAEERDIMCGKAK